ncbi:MAG: ead/Ea22-like family protein [Klebsiella oxytoca]|nr:ead/Ea22-like family protein [Klebsiella oxytoca]
MARREFFTPLHALCESGKRVVSTRALRDAVERAEEHMVSQVSKIVDGHDRLTKKLKEAESRNAELVEALEKAQTKNALVAGGIEAVAKLHERIAELESRTVSAAAADVLAERQRQVTAEGWSSKHDDQYKNTELAFAASCYAFHAAAASWDLEDDGIPYDSHPVPKQWPWDPSWWKPTDARRDLVKAGALILAEIERIDRAAGIKWEAE